VCGATTLNHDLTSITGIQMSQTELENAIQRLCYFAPTGSGEYVRELHEFLALQSMSMLPAKLLTAREIHNRVVASIGQRFEFEEILEALNRLVHKNKIACTIERVHEPEARFRLSIDERNAMRRQVDAEQSLERIVLLKWRETTQLRHPHLTSTDLDLLVSDLKVFALRLLSQQSIETLQLYYGDSNSIHELLARFDNAKISEGWNSGTPEYESIRVQAVTGFFREADDERKQYIASLMHSVFLLQLTQLDPTCAQIVRMQLSEAIVYLDTNFVFRLVGLQGPDLFLASKKLADISQRLGFRLAISPQTLSEYSHTLSEFLKEVKDRPVITSELAALALQSTSDEDFITAYWKEAAHKSKGSYVDPSTFYEYYRYLEQILGEMGITVNDSHHAEIIEDDERIALEESLLREVMQSYSSRAADNVSQFVLKHDVYHRLLVLHHRRDIPQEIFGNARAWFLTCDTKLPPYDRVARSKQGMLARLPFCATSGQWLQTLRPFIGGNGDLDIAQVDMIVSPLLRAYQRPPSHLINNVISRLSMSQNYSLPAASAMLSNQQFLEQFDKAQEPHVQQDLIDNFYASYADEIEAQARHLKEQLQRIEKQRELEAQRFIEESKKRQELEAAVIERGRTNAELQAYQDVMNANLLSSQQREDREKSEKERILREKVELEKEYQSKLAMMQATQQNEKIQMKRKIVFSFVVGISLILFFALRQPWQMSQSPWLESVGATLIGLYLVYCAVYDFWRHRQGVLLTVIIPLCFIASFLMPVDISNGVQVMTSLATLVIAITDYSRKTKT
jgi:hypothetical protein